MKTQTKKWYPHPIVCHHRKMFALFSTDFDFDLIVPPTPVIKTPPAAPEGPERLGTPGNSWRRYHRPKNVIFTPVFRPGF